MRRAMELLERRKQQENTLPEKIARELQVP
jgi:hypothetical protein